MIELALEAHSSILVDSYHTKETEKRAYISKCVEDIRKVSGMERGHVSGMEWDTSTCRRRVCSVYTAMPIWYQYVVKEATSFLSHAVSNNTVSSTHVCPHTDKSPILYISLVWMAY